MRVARRLVGGVVVLELLGVGGALGLFHMMNDSRDFRKTMKKKFPSILEVYYQSNEWAGVRGVREQDQEAWSTRRE